MFLTPKQAEERLKSEKNLARASFITKKEDSNANRPAESAETSVKIEERLIKHGRNFAPGLTRKKRNEIAARARLGESQSTIAREENLVPSTVHNIEHGRTKGIDELEVTSMINEVKDRALDRLMHSLGLLSDDKLSSCSAKDLSVIASNMGRVVEKIQPKIELADNINFIIYTPELKSEKAFKIVEI